MFRRLSITRDRSESTSSTKSPPISPTGRIHPFYQHPSGSRFTEEAASAVLSSETGSASDATSLGVSSTISVPAWGGRPSRFQKLRRARRPFSRAPPPAHADKFIGDTSSEITSSTWTVSLHAYRLCARMALIHIHHVCIVGRRDQYQYQYLHRPRCRYIRYRSVLYHILRNRLQSTTGCKYGQARVLRSSSSAPSTPKEVSSAANSCTRPSLPTVMRCETSYLKTMGS